MSIPLKGIAILKIVNIIYQYKENYNFYTELIELIIRTYKVITHTGEDSLFWTEIFTVE